MLRGTLWSWIRTGRKPPTPRTRRPRAETPALEALEQRTLLSAGLLGIVPTAPFIAYNNTGHIDYAAATQALTVNASSLSFQPVADAPADFIFNPDGGYFGTVQIGAVVDNAGQLVSGVPGDDLVVTGDVDLDGDFVPDISGVLLTGEITGFGSLDTGTTVDKYDFRFTLTGGLLASYYAGQDLGITMTSENSSFDGTFAQDFHGKAKGNIGALPQPPVTIGDFVWNDLNANGIQDAGEPGIPGVKLDLSGTDALGQPVGGTTTTDATGYYQFTEVPGTYSVTVDAGSPALAGFIASPTQAGTNRAVDSNVQPAGTTPALLPPGGSDQTLDFGYFQPVSISGAKFRDLTGNGLTADDTPLGGVTIQLFRDNGNGFLDAGDGAPIASTTTAADTGAYSFTGLAPGKYFAQEVLVAPYVRTAPALSSYYMIPAVAGGTYSGNNFANFLPGPCRSYITNITYVLNGTTTVTDLRGQTHQGDVVTANFTVTGDHPTFSLVAYTAPSGAWVPSEAPGQVIFEQVTQTYSAPGNYSLTVQLPNSYYQVDFICGPAIDHFGVPGSNILYSAQGRLISADNGGTEPRPANFASLAGAVFLDVNNDGTFQATESGIPGTKVKVTGVDDLGKQVNIFRLTDAAGAYTFRGLRPGTYQIAEVQPAGYVDGIDTVGTQGGTLGSDVFSNIVLTGGVNGTGNIFGELLSGPCLSQDMTATIGFWHNCNGQALLNSLNGGCTAKNLGNWLAATFPHLYERQAGTHNLTGKTNSQVASVYQSLYSQYGMKLDADVLATAFAVYATNSSLAGGTMAARYGFIVSSSGTGSATFNVGYNGAAFGVANNTKLTVLEILKAADKQAVNGVLYNGNSSLRNMANTVFDAINQAGDIT